MNETNTTTVSRLSDSDHDILISIAASVKSIEQKNLLRDAEISENTYFRIKAGVYFAVIYFIVCSLLVPMFLHYVVKVI